MMQSGESVDSIEQDSAVKSFSQVLFLDISDYFQPSKDVRISYTVTNSLEPTSRDWIGLFKVGWSSAREYLTFVWAPALNSSSDRTVSVIFSAYYLPVDKVEFYQFCYVTRLGNIRGASTPFQFRDRAECDQLIEVEDENGMIVLKTKTAALEEKVEVLSVEKKNLEMSFQQLNSDKESVESKINEISNELNDVKREQHLKNLEYEGLLNEKKGVEEDLKALTEEKKNLIVKNSKQSSELENAAFAIAKLTKETLRWKSDCEEAAEEHQKEVTSLSDQLDAKAEEYLKSEIAVNELMDKVKKLECQTSNLLQKSQDVDEIQANVDALTKELDAAVQKASILHDEKKLFKDQFMDSEESRREVMQMVASMKSEMKMKDNMISNRQEELIVYEKKIQLLNDELKTTKTNAAHQMSTLESQLNNAEDKLNACEASKRLIATELTEARDTRDKLMSDLNQAKKERIAENVSTNKMKHCDTSCQTIFATEKNVPTSGPEEIIQTGEIPFVEEQNVKDLKAQVEDLRTRLTLGAAAYKEKYMECHKLEKRLKKLDVQKTKLPVGAQAALSDSTASDSHDDATQQKALNMSGQKKHSDMKQEKNEGGVNLMGRLEQIFMTIADPDAQEQDQLKARLSKLEKNLQSQNSKCRKYKQLYKEVKDDHLVHYEKSMQESLFLKQELGDLKATYELQHNENQALKEQLKEYMTVMKSTSPEPATPSMPPIKGRNVILKNTKQTSNLGSGGIYPHDVLFDESNIITRNSSDSDLSEDFEQMNRSYGGVGLCPKNQPSEDSDPVQIPRNRKQDVLTNGAVVKHQPTRSPPVVELVSPGTARQSAGAVPKQKLKKGGSHKARKRHA